MGLTLISEFKGYEIYYDEDKERFIAVAAGKAYKTPDFEGEHVADVKKEINDTLKADFKRVECFKFDGGWYGNGSSKIVKAVITSVRENGEAWITREDKSREKCSIGHLIKITPENVERIKKYEELAAQKEKIDKEMEEIKNSCERFKQQDF